MNYRIPTRVMIALVLVAAPAYAQVDIEGNWAARQHEDAPERGGGPEIGEYQGLPINDAARKVEATVAEKMGSLTAGMGLPAGLKLPF